jgi:hypothetical protein
MERTEPTTEFLGDTPEPVRDHLAAAQDLLRSWPAQG